MMKLQTNVPLEKVVHPITYNDSFLLMGSCFVTHIAEKFSYYKLPNAVNPFGVIFQPAAIAKLIERAVNVDYFTEEDLFYFNEQWHCYEVHSQLSNSDKEQCLTNLNAALDVLKTGLETSSYFVLTLGTAWVYRFIETDSLVANCHKVPQKRFLKELLTVDEVMGSVQAIVALIRSINPEIRVLTTVSPVRHLKDGFVENMRSKAHLIAGLQEVVNIRKHIYYFPSYEIMMDELRDYRFYKEDMVHPNSLAVSYIWERFVATWVAEEGKKVMEEVETVQKGLAHKPFNPTSEAHQKFLQKLHARVAVLQKEYPFMKF
ncbi:GSCFA domain-containing protein [Neptunitalea lumnitzerae]|uniref:GSCFA domain-containing protein n=1 Tax=Neptunitalea lumnitzerae TaxID=2965509 RepID=A0ABQ5ME66_9FLAO|nr:GSCFA domain-containing protein [Neptunitalea sp. Y10]GLB47670.1 hypothetical protein Y10_00380 [Neptunitalea sp. Y10]